MLHIPHWWETTTSAIQLCVPHVDHHALHRTLLAFSLSLCFQGCRLSYSLRIWHQELQVESHSHPRCCCHRWKIGGVYSAIGLKDQGKYIIVVENQQRVDSLFLGRDIRPFWNPGVPRPPYLKRSQSIIWRFWHRSSRRCHGCPKQSASPMALTLPRNFSS